MIYLKYRCVVFDSHLLPPNGTLSAGASIPFFNPDKPDEGEIVTKVAESEIIKWLLGFPVVKNLIMEELGVGQMSFVTDLVKHPVIRNHNDRPGDVDLLICPGGNASEAIGIQAKRVL